MLLLIQQQNKGDKTMNKKTFRGYPIMAEKETIEGRAVIVYSQYDMGAKYKIYTSRVDDGYNIVKYIIAFTTMGEAQNYFNKIK